MGDVILYLEHPPSSLASSGSGSCCRICHEEEFESCNSLETPCACSGTVKFAHRDCIQRWCDEKGNTTCDLCLQKYEPDYTAPSGSNKSNQLDSAITIRDSLEFPRDEDEEEDESWRSYVRVESGRGVYARVTEYQMGADRFAQCSRSVALILTLLLLMRHLRATITNGTQDYPFTLPTLLLLRSSGIIVPMFLVIRAITAIHRRIRQHCQVQF